MRALAFGVIALAAASFAQTVSGKYTASGGSVQSWEINAAHSLIWDGKPYLPVGLRIDGTPEEVARAKAAGYGDVIVDLPAGGTGWTETLKALDAAGMRYLISISSLSPMAEGVAIDPAGYRVSGITKPQRLQVKLPGATSALAVIVNRRDSSVASTQRLAVVDGVLSMDVKPLSELEQVLLIYPHMRSLEQPDLWDALDEHRDRLLATVRAHPLGAGLRGIVNPFGRMAMWTRSELRFVPTSNFFRSEFAGFLKEKYKSLETAMKAWSMTASDIDSFDRLARLAPLWSGPQRGISQLWDADSDRLYNCNSMRSLVWSDIQSAIAAAATRRYARVASALQSVVDVPLIQEWSGWLPAYETPTPALDGLGMRAYGTTPSALLETGSRTTSSILRWQKTGWLLATDIDPGTSKDVVDQLSYVLDDLTSLGARGWFLRASSPDIVKAMAAQANRSNDGTLVQSTPVALFYPENAFNPATPQRLPGNHWWLPSPANGNRLDLGNHFFAYRYQEGNQSFTALWSDQQPTRVKLRMAAPKLATFTSVDATPLNPKLSKDGAQITLGQVPVIIGGTEEIPIPEPAYAETLAQMNQLFSAADALLLDITEPKYLFRDALAGFDRNPGACFAIMRQQFARVSLRLARYTWIEAESTRNHNFSQALASAGCSNGAMLNLRTQIASPPDGYFAEYTVPVRSIDEVEIWVAARIPPEQRDAFSLTLAGDTYTIKSDPVSPYGQGFGWYLLGTTRLGGNQTKMRIQVTGPSADLALDAIAIMPGHFRPEGVAMPDAINFAVPKKGKGGKGGF